MPQLAAVAVRYKTYVFCTPRSLCANLTCSLTGSAAGANHLNYLRHIQPQMQPGLPSSTYAVVYADGHQVTRPHWLN
jgi:hypothetical protein